MVLVWGASHWFSLNWGDGERVFSIIWGNFCESQIRFPGFWLNVGRMAEAGSVWAFFMSCWMVEGWMPMVSMGRSMTPLNVGFRVFRPAKMVEIRPFFQFICSVRGKVGQLLDISEKCCPATIIVVGHPFFVRSWYCFSTRKGLFPSFRRAFGVPMRVDAPPVRMSPAC